MCHEPEIFIHELRPICTLRGPKCIHKTSNHIHMRRVSSVTNQRPIYTTNQRSIYIYPRDLQLYARDRIIYTRNGESLVTNQSPVYITNQRPIYTEENLESIRKRSHYTHKKRL